MPGPELPRWQPKRLGDHVIPAPVKVEVKSEPGAPRRWAVFDVVDGRLECREVQVTAVEGGREVRKSDLRSIPLDELRDEVAAWSRPVETVRGDLTLIFEEPDDSEQRAALRNLDRTRRRLTEDDLRRVAEVYAAAEHAPTRAVADAFGVAHRTASLYVQQARGAGLLPAYSPKRRP